MRRTNAGTRADTRVGSACESPVAVALLPAVPRLFAALARNCMCPHECGHGTLRTCATSHKALDFRACVRQVLSAGYGKFRSTERFVESGHATSGFDTLSIRQTWRTLKLNLQLLAEDLADPQTPQERRALDRVQRLTSECDRMTTQSDDFLRFARVKDLDRAETDLFALIDELLDFAGPTIRAHGIDVKVYVPGGLTVLLDRGLFKQALLNLLLNAEQAMPEGGELTIQATAECEGGRETGGQQDELSELRNNHPPKQPMRQNR